MGRAPQKGRVVTCVLRAPTLLLRVSSHHGPLTGTGRVSCPLPAFVALAAGPERVTEAARSSERERAQRGRAHEPSVNKADKSSPCVNRQPSPVQCACVLDTQGPRGGLSRGPERAPAASDGIPAAAPSFAGATATQGARGGRRSRARGLAEERRSAATLRDRSSGVRSVSERLRSAESGRAVRARAPASNRAAAAARRGKRARRPRAS